MFVDQVRPEGAGKMAGHGFASDPPYALDFDRHDIAATKLAVDRQIEHGEVSDTTVKFEFRPD